MKIGTYYYPEQWPQDQWERDFDQMAAMRLQIVHMAEFAWHAMEPREGEFRFEWLDRCLELAKARKMDVILCTPTAAPPVWLVTRHPDILPIDDCGRAARPGGRRHYTPASQAYQDAARRIVTAMADRFGNHPSVIGWQIDNEYSGALDQSEQTHRAFQQWLRAKYQTIEKLNAAWGLQFWNQYFDDFAQIKLSPRRDAGYGNPHHVLDSLRFWSHAFAQFNKLQADILKPRVGDRFITTNFMPFHPEVDPAEMKDDLTLFSWDAYPVAGREVAPGNDEYRIADPAQLGFLHEQMASYTGRWGVLELQPGHVNWSSYPVLPYPGAIRLWIWTALAHGAEFVTTYRFRQPRFGVELFHDGLIEPDGVSPSPGGQQFVQAIDELKLIDQAKWNQDAGAIDAARTIGLVFDFDQLFYFESLPQAKRWNQPHWLRLWYAAAARLGLRVKILHPKQDWPKELKLVVVPAMQMVDPADVKQMTRFVADGGHLVITCRTGWMDRTGQLFEGKTAQPVLDLIGGEIEAYDSLPEQTWGHVDLDGHKHPWGVWADLLYAREGTKVLAKYADQFYAGAAAVTQCRHENGGATTYVGVHGEASFVDALMEKVATQAGLERATLPSRVQLIRRGPYRVLLNYQDKAYAAPAPPRVKFLVGSRRVDPAGVAIWEE